jgi:hypothetical protein
VILLNDVVEILDLADLDIGIMVGVVACDRRRVGAAFVDRDLLRNTMTTDCITGTQVGQMTGQGRSGLSCAW